MPSCLGQQRGQQMQRVDLRIAAVGGQLLGALHGLLGLDRQFVEAKCHGGFAVSLRMLPRRDTRELGRKSTANPSPRALSPESSVDLR